MNSARHFNAATRFASSLFVLGAALLLTHCTSRPSLSVVHAPGGRSFRIPNSGLAMYHYPQYGIWQSAERGYLPNPNYSEFAFAQDLTTVLVADERLPASHRIRVLPDGRLRAEPAGSPYYGAVNSAAQPMVAPRQRDDVQVAGAGSPAQPTVRRAVPQPVVRRATAEPTRYPRVFRDRRGRVYVKPWRGGEWVTSAGAYEFSAYGNPFEAAMELTSELRSEQKIPPGYRARIRGDGSIQIVGSQTM